MKWNCVRYSKSYAQRNNLRASFERPRCFRELQTTELVFPLVRADPLSSCLIYWLIREMTADITIIWNNEEFMRMNSPQFIHSYILAFSWSMATVNGPIPDDFMCDTSTRLNSHTFDKVCCINLSTRMRQVTFALHHLFLITTFFLHFCGRSHRWISIRKVFTWKFWTNCCFRTQRSIFPFAGLRTHIMWSRQWRCTYCLRIYSVIFSFSDIPFCFRESSFFRSVVLHW